MCMLTPPCLASIFSKNDKVLWSASSAGIDKRDIMRLAFLPISVA
uniref:Uncharacterized protein n=1 Tax=Arundo donax TaxID=35708 RepID=A0A0A9BSL2_ARUDO